jgi:hypothetical protein
MTSDRGRAARHMPPRHHMPQMAACCAAMMMLVVAHAANQRSVENALLDSEDYYAVRC